MDNKILPDSNKRLKELIDKLFDKNVAKFAKQIHVGHQSVNRVFNIDSRSGKYPEVSFKIINGIINYLPKVNSDWIIGGKGEMLKQPDVFQVGDQNINVSGSRNSNIGNRNEAYRRTAGGINGEPQQGTGIPMIPFECIAGYGEDNAGIKLNDCEWYNIPEFENIGAEFLVRVGGSSMYPKYSSGDILACRKIHDILFFQWGKIYVIDSSQGQLIKRVFEHENEDMIMLVSDNREKYPPFPMPRTDIRSLSIVLGVVRME